METPSGALTRRQTVIREETQEGEGRGDSCNGSAEAVGWSNWVTTQEIPTWDQALHHHPHPFQASWAPQGDLT